MTIVNGFEPFDWWQLLPAPLQIFSCTPSFLKKTVLPPFKNDFRIILSEIFLEHLFQNMFYAFRIYQSGNKKNVFQKRGFRMIFCLLNFLFRKYLLLTESLFQKHKKTVKSNFGIFEECRV